MSKYEPQKIPGAGARAQWRRLHQLAGFFLFGLLRRARRLLSNREGCGRPADIARGSGSTAAALHGQSRAHAYYWALAAAVGLLVCGADVWAAGVVEVRILGLSADAFGTAILAGLVAWGGQLATLLWLRRDINIAHERITRHEQMHHNQKGNSQ